MLMAAAAAAAGVAGKDKKTVTTTGAAEMTVTATAIATEAATATRAGGDVEDGDVSCGGSQKSDGGLSGKDAPGFRKVKGGERNN